MNDSIDLSALRPARLTRLSALRIAGADARSFLQGQLSAEMDELGPGRALLATCNSAQGRVQAVLWLLERSDGIALVLPDSMLLSTAARLRKYVLRSKVKIDSTSGRLTAGVVDPGALPGIAALAADRSHVEQSGVSLLRLPGHTQLLALADAPDWRDADAGIDLTWRLDDIRAGLPQVYPETHEAFVAQMLNIDLLDGVSFTKGCYTGQEIIARTHYRGAIKRRMFRFKAACPPPAPGTRIVAGDQHAGDVVDAAAMDGGCELLAVVSLALRDQRLELVSGGGAILERAPLPYEAEGEP